MSLINVKKTAKRRASTAEFLAFLASVVAGTASVTAEKSVKTATPSRSFIRTDAA